MNFFASDETKKIKLNCGIELDVKADVSKKVFNKLLSVLPQDVDADRGISVQQATEFSSALFSIFVVGWNLDRDVTVDNYFELRREFADEIDEALGNHFSAITVTEKESRKS